MMNTARFEKLATELAFCAGLASDDPFHETRVMKLNGLDTLLFYDEAFDPGRLQIRMDFGGLPKDPVQLNALLLSVLSLNFVYGMGGLAVFSVDSSNAHLVLTTQHGLDTTVTAQDLLAVLQESHAQAVSAWGELNANGFF